MSISQAEIVHSVRTRTVEDRTAWDTYIAELKGSILQSWNWGEFKARHGWSVRRIAGECAGSPCFAAQILIRRLTPFSVLYVPRGPACHELGEQVATAMTLSIDRIASEQRSAIAFLEPESLGGGQLPDAGDLHWLSSATELQPLRTIKVPVDRDDDEILAGMKSKTRYNVRLAGRRGVTVREGTIEDIVPFYQALEETSERDEFGIHGIEYYADMLDVFGERASLLLAEYEGRIVSGAIVLHHGDEAIYMFGASLKEYQRHMPSHLIQFEAMRRARQRGCRTYDLWGIPPTDTPPDEAQDGEVNVRSGLWGVYRFKQGFGGEIVSYPGVFERHYYPRLVRIWRRVRPGLGT